MQQKYTLLLVLLAAAGCSSAPDASTGTSSDEDLTREPAHRHQHKLWFDSGTTTQPQDDSGTTQPQDAGSTQQQPDSGTTNTFIPAGWLYTSGNHVYVSNGTTGTVWVGRGVNVDDTYLCGYNGSQWMTNSEQSLTSMMSGLMSGWKPSFVRISLSMYSFAQNPATWVGTSAYKTSMTNIITSLTNAGVYVMVTVRSDSTMTEANNAEETGTPTNSTDATYTALVDSFANNKYILFGLSNEPGGNSFSNATLRSAMDHATSAIRTEEDKLGVPHHIVSAQGNTWTSDISFYASQPLTQDNVVYEVHGYPPPTSSYTYSNIPVIIGEYGTLSNAQAFFSDLETKQLPSVAWDFDSYSNCAPDLLTVNLSATNLVNTSWGTTVQNYLLAH